ncbi:GntR family transcriptional regulator [Micromonospora sp. LH3U1]|uniref:GntR family transcriptional regulator n=1 Tax=Micromonospora sp. LH3U1 TaxID=3018339 RepID=UPI0023493584|nr:GntR family transcriptional regulator [Micromonospora sp. LH3U1]WCN80926.1 GntR family transcriptional regulator [Micromonospora sp. LH3U1]
MPTPHFGQPRYRAIADELRERIESGAIPPGALLPTESALTAEFRAARGTVRQAIAALRADGYVTTEHGRATYASLRPSADRETTAHLLTTAQREVAADPELAALFAVEVGTPLVEQQNIDQSCGTVKAVVRTYRLLRPSQ